MTAAKNKRSSGRVTPKKEEKVATGPLEIRVDPTKGLSPKQIDILRAASGWKTSDLFDEDGDPTGKLMAGRMWLAIRSERPDVTPEQVYEADDLSEFGIELVADGEPDPTKAAG